MESIHQKVKEGLTYIYLGLIRSFITYISQTYLPARIAMIHLLPGAREMMPSQRNDSHVTCSSKLSHTRQDNMYVLNLITPQQLQSTKFSFSAVPFLLFPAYLTRELRGRKRKKPTLKRGSFGRSYAWAEQINEGRSWYFTDITPLVPLIAM